MNWGHKITIVIALFIIAMLSMVYLAFQQTNEMVETNYYDKELKYQLKIDAAENLNSISSNEVLVAQNEKYVQVSLPKNTIKSFARGSIEFYKSDDKSKDKNLSFEPDSNGVFRIDGKEFVSGLYKVRLQWQSNDKSYYREQDLMVQK
ncbi:MAG: FixH family protein [bacterium]|nr:FixH family protein [bacterium]